MSDPPLHPLFWSGLAPGFGANAELAAIITAEAGGGGDDDIDAASAPPAPPPAVGLPDPPSRAAAGGGRRYAGKFREAQDAKLRGAERLRAAAPYTRRAPAAAAANSAAAAPQPQPQQPRRPDRAAVELTTLMSLWQPSGGSAAADARADEG